MVDQDVVEHALALSISTAPNASGQRPVIADPSLVVVQELVEGEEFGLDVVCSFEGEYQAVLARKKLKMRAGETDRAVTVSSEPFDMFGRDLANALSLRGLTDVDVIVRSDGKPVVIDINPRFGGGYPFSHLAGANVPACYVAWVTGNDIRSDWLQPRPGVVSSKYEAIRSVQA